MKETRVIFEEVAEAAIEVRATKARLEYERARAETDTIEAYSGGQGIKAFGNTLADQGRALTVFLQADMKYVEAAELYQVAQNKYDRLLAQKEGLLFALRESELDNTTRLTVGSWNVRLPVGIQES